MDDDNPYAPPASDEPAAGPASALDPRFQRRRFIARAGGLPWQRVAIGDDDEEPLFTAHERGSSVRRRLVVVDAATGEPALALDGSLFDQRYDLRDEAGLRIGAIERYGKVAWSPLDWTLRDHANQRLGGGVVDRRSWVWGWRAGRLLRGDEQCTSASMQRSAGLWRQRITIDIAAESALRDDGRFLIGLVVLAMTRL